MPRRKIFWDLLDIPISVSVRKMRIPENAPKAFFLCLTSEQRNEIERKKRKFKEKKKYIQVMRISF